MPPAARGAGTDSVFSKTGSGRGCGKPVTTATAACSGDVFFNNKGAVRIGDAVASHSASGCGPDGSALTSSSSSVFVNGKGVARIGDQYTGDNTITSGSSDIFIG
jgi:uncharacterized Zn-binding protein involved in type VI secretion